MTWARRGAAVFASGVTLVTAAAWSGLGGPLPASASFISSPTPPALTASTGSLAAPSGLSASRGNCVINSSVKVNLSWTATSTTWADGYDVLRGTSSGNETTLAGHVTNRSTTSFTDSGVTFSTTYFYVVKATVSTNWKSPASNEVSITTQTLLCV